MKILSISGRNLASLAAEFCIDFEQEPLASAGLFAISGPTGAGKSTLLDALCLALYDATPRLLKRKAAGAMLPDVGSDTVGVQDPRTLLRRGAAEAYAQVDFLGNDKLRYRARWAVRRSRGKPGGALQKSTLTLHRLHDQIALGGTNTEVAHEIVQRIGLSFEQFTRAVLLAQNEFSAFLKTEENERGELLETLTGSAVYSAISRRAFERFRQEQAAMQQLSARLADHTPLDADARTLLETQCTAAESALELAETRKLALEQQLRWHQEADKLQRSVLQAEDALTAARAASDAAGARRRLLQAIDAAEPARPLLADCARLAGDIGALEQGGAAATQQLADTQQVQARALAAVSETGAVLQAAELAQQQAVPALDQAKALDASIAALTPSHQTAAEQLRAAQAATQLASMTLAALQDQLAGNRTAHQQDEAWLAAHRDWEALAARWPRWDTLLVQARQLRADEAAHAADVDSARQALDAAGAGDAGARERLSEAGARLALLEGARQQAIAALAACDAAGLRARRQALEQHRAALTAASRTWNDTLAALARQDELKVQAASIQAAYDAAATALSGALAAATPLDSALAQAERSLKAAETACAASVTDLRATLADGEPCPVCGSAEHPWQHQDAALQGMLDQLRLEVARCRQEVQDNRAIQASARALLASGEQQLAAGGRDALALQATLDRLRGEWDQGPLAPHAPAAELRGAWLEQELQALREASGTLDTEEQAAQQAAVVRDQAQQACDSAAASHAGLQQAALASQAALANAQARHEALVARRLHAAQGLEAQLTELDAAFGANWRPAWRADPASFHAEREAQVRQSRERQQAFSARGAALQLLQAELASQTQRVAQAQLASDSADAEFQRIDADIGAKRAQRAQLWQGRPVREIEQQLATSVQQARDALAAQQGASQQAAQGETRAREALAQLSARLAATREQAACAEQALAAWLAGSPDVEGRAGLAALLAHERAWCAAERAALQALDAAAAGAAAILAERRSQHALHQQSAVPGDAASVEAALIEQATARKAAMDQAGALRLRLAQDNARRAQAQAMLAEIEQQQQIELRWARLNELIGSADGKKFRNYAQQFTLDVLLGYANAHLAQLARRYRLERVASAGGPSLGLLVRDQDMGGEIRSVNSLSGGESFLVSLALALGLASLSSNRVRVESLFIDEGFGSLDSETLRVAMDALDGLQSMGRKVGVISHVQEMTERIATRILVQPAGGGTSTVSV